MYVGIGRRISDNISDILFGHKMSSHAVKQITSA